MSASTERTGVERRDLTQFVEDCLSASGGPPIKSVVPEDCAYSSSHAIETFRVDLMTGASSEVVCKDLSRRAMPAGGRAKPAFLDEPLREIELYRSMLPHLGLGTAACLGSLVDPSVGRYWLLLEKIQGRPLWQCDASLWQMAARWLARLHTCAPPPPQYAAHLRLLEYNEAYFASWPQLALKRWGSSAPAAGLLDYLARRYGAVAARLASLPRALIHGDYFPANILVANIPGRTICPVDWELAGLGPGLLDLAALCSGNWRPEEREGIVVAYIEESRKLTGRTPGVETLEEDLVFCSLHLAVQFLAWPAEWRPPPEQQHDWLATAERLVEESRL